MNVLLGFVHAFLYMLTLALTYAHYAEVNVVVPEWAYYFLAIAVAGVSLLIAIGHVIGGGLMGMTAGGVWDGMRLGITLGLGVALGRLWPYAIIVAVVGFITQAPVWHWLLAGFLGLIFFGIHFIMKFIWTKVS